MNHLWEKMCVTTKLIPEAKCIVGAFVQILQKLVGLVHKNNAVQLLCLDMCVVISPKKFIHANQSILNRTW